MTADITQDPRLHPPNGTTRYDEPRRAGVRAKADVLPRASRPRAEGQPASRTAVLGRITPGRPHGAVNRSTGGAR